jgi:hypothetical protein
VDYILHNENMHVESLNSFDTVLVIDKNSDVVNTMGVEILNRVACSDMNGKIYVANLFGHPLSYRNGRIIRTSI